MFIDQAQQIFALVRSGEVVEIGAARTAPVHSEVRRNVSYLRLAFAFAAIYLIWGSTYLAIRYAVEAIPPLLMMGIRHFVAGAALYAWLRWRGTPAPSRSQWKRALIAGSIFFLGAHGSLAWAEKQVPSGLAALLNATLPLWIVLLTWWSGKRRVLSRSVTTGLVLGFLGVVVLIGPSALYQRSALLLDAVVLGGAFLWALGTIYTQRGGLPESASLSAAMQMLSGGAALFVASLAVGERMNLSQVTAKSAVSLVYLIVFGSLIAFSAFTWLHTVVSAARISTYAYVNPVVAVFLGWMMGGETIGVRTLVATATILAAVALVNRGRRETTAPASPQYKPAPVSRSWYPQAEC